ncbi:MAG: hypothetical protein Q9187_006438 [Circinaria calcarea]
MATESLLLADLCKICHTNPPKYRCPRCSTRTCSLTCIKRHKLWALCNGIRDPAAYKTRDQLATPTSIDQDYNFIAGIERGLEGAERDSRARGVPLKEKAVTRDGPVKGEVNLRQALERSGVRIEKAPVGMSRSRQNKTSWSKNQRCISWTIEWVLDDSRRALGNCLDNQAISEAYAKEFQPSQAQKQPPKKKRKLQVAAPPDPDEAPSTNPATDALHPFLPESLHPPPPAPSEPPTPLSPSPALHFYLHIPRTSVPTKKTALVPLSRTSTLAGVLRSRIVLEFPTIYALKQPPESLPEDFMLLEERGGGGGKVEDMLTMLGNELDHDASGEGIKVKIEEEEGRATGTGAGV